MTTAYKIRTAGDSLVLDAPEPPTPAEIADMRERAEEQIQQEAVAEDVTIAYLIRERDATDTGERMTVEELAVSLGYDPADFAQ
jgi:hypothetical protein